MQHQRPRPGRSTTTTGIQSLLVSLVLYNTLTTTLQLMRYLAASSATSWPLNHYHRNSTQPYRCSFTTCLSGTHTTPRLQDWQTLRPCGIQVQQTTLRLQDWQTVRPCGIQVQQSTSRPQDWQTSRPRGTLDQLQQMMRFYPSSEATS